MESLEWITQEVYRESGKIKPTTSDFIEHT